MDQFVYCTAKGVRSSDISEPADVLVCIYGPKGGTRCIERFSLEQAKALRNELDLAISAIEKG